MRISLAQDGLDLQIGGQCLFAGTGRTNHPHRHPEFQEICWVLSGTGCFRHAGRRFALAAGSCFL